MEFQCNRTKTCDCPLLPGWGPVAYPTSLTCSRVNIWHCPWNSYQLNVCWPAMTSMARGIPNKTRGNFLSGENIPLQKYTALGCCEIGKSKRNMFHHLKIARIWRRVICFRQDSRESKIAQWARSLWRYLFLPRSVGGRNRNSSNVIHHTN